MSLNIIDLAKTSDLLGKIDLTVNKKANFVATGEVTRSVGLTLEGKGIKAAIGTMCEIETSSGAHVKAVVTGFTHDRIFMMPTSDVQGLELGAKITTKGEQVSIPVCDQLLGRVIDANGKPLDGKGDIPVNNTRYLWPEPLNPLTCAVIDTPLDVGIKTINGLITIGVGQRIGLFAGSGVGKSVLLGMISKFSQADVVVVGLIGERGREVKEFVEHNLGVEGLKKAVVVATPANYSPVLRYQGALAAMCVAEYFRDQGKKVLLLLDSLTRFAQAQREIALSMGEPPATKGYPPSVFKSIPQLVERAGMGREGGGSITAIFTVLAEGDDNNDPIVDASRAILDGHILLTRKLADLGHFPAIDINRSVSRVMSNIVDKSHQQAARLFKKFYAIYEENQDLINIGAYVSGNNPQLDFAIKHIDKFNKFLQQEVEDKVTYEQTLNSIFEILTP
jgi:flagellum-specific ATP synthase